MTQPTIRQLCSDLGVVLEEHMYSITAGMFSGLAMCVRNGTYRTDRPEDVKAVFTRLLEIESDYNTEVKIAQIRRKK